MWHPHGLLQGDDLRRDRMLINCDRPLDAACNIDLLPDYLLAPPIEYLAPGPWLRFDLGILSAKGKLLGTVSPPA